MKLETSAAINNLLDALWHEPDFGLKHKRLVRELQIAIGARPRKQKRPHHKMRAHS